MIYEIYAYDESKADGNGGEVMIEASEYQLRRKKDAFDIAKDIKAKHPDWIVGISTRNNEERLDWEWTVNVNGEVK